MPDVKFEMTAGELSDYISKSFRTSSIKPKFPKLHFKLHQWSYRYHFHNILVGWKWYQRWSESIQAYDNWVWMNQTTKDMNEKIMENIIKTIEEDISKTKED